LAQYFGSAEKSYEGRIRFGFSTDTFDSEGEATSVDVFEAVQSEGTDEDAARVGRPELTLARVHSAAARFSGEMLQTPPPYSAKKIQGTPAYKLAREGKPVELKAVKVHIDRFEITGLTGTEAAFEMSISAGGYVRSVAHELGQDLGFGAHLSGLRRTRAGVFGIDDAHTLEELEALHGNPAGIEALCIHPRSLLMEMPAVGADANVRGRFRNGAQANLPEFSRAPLVKVFAGQRELVGIAKRVAGTLFQPVVVMA
jgi:tRNA pseudouridine55 synthase